MTTALLTGALLIALLVVSVVGGGAVALLTRYEHRLQAETEAECRQAVKQVRETMSLDRDALRQDMQRAASETLSLRRQDVQRGAVPEEEPCPT